MRKQEGYPHPDEEQIELKRMGEEAEEWIKLAGLLLKDLTTKDEKESQPPVDEEERKEKSTEEPEEGEDGLELPDKLPEEMNVIGVDDNIHSKSLQQAIEEVRVY